MQIYNKTILYIIFNFFLLICGSNKNMNPRVIWPWYISSFHHSQLYGLEQITNFSQPLLPLLKMKIITHSSYKIQKHICCYVTEFCFSYFRPLQLTSPGVCWKYRFIQWKSRDRLRQRITDACTGIDGNKWRNHIHCSFAQHIEHIIYCNVISISHS